MALSHRRPCLPRSCHARKNRHSTRAGGSAQNTLNMGDMFGLPADPIISVRWRLFSFCFDARQPPRHRPSTNKKKPERPWKGTFRLPIGIRADGMEGPTGVSADQGCCRWPGPPGPPCPPPPGPGPGPHGPQQAPRAPSTSRTAPKRMTLRCRLLFMHFLQGMVKNQPTIFSGRTHSSNWASVT